MTRIMIDNLHAIDANLGAGTAGGLTPRAARVKRWCEVFLMGCGFATVIAFLASPFLNV